MFETFRSRLGQVGLLLFLLGITSLSLCSVACAQDEPAATETEVAAAETAPAFTVEDETKFALDNITLFVCAVLVMFMQAGFAMVEVGLNPAKHTVNILFKNLMDLAIGVLLYYFIGYGLMYPGFEPGQKGIVGFSGVIGIAEFDNIPAPGKLLPQVDFLFQVAFAATAATIVSGAVAGRMKFGAYLIYSAVITGFVYPISGSWQWGKGWLADMGFHDFAGSILVHCVGGFAGLAGAILLGPRLGRFTKDGRSNPIPGHNLSFATLGVFILWIGWYGFNPGSQLAFSTTGNVAMTMLVATNTTLAASIGACICMTLAWILYGKPDLTMALNGALGGLVGITANCDAVTNIESLYIGGIAGALVLVGIILLEKLRIDDPVGAFPVHGIAGMWGGIATGIFGDYDLKVQLIGTLVVAGWSFANMMVLFGVLRAFNCLRVTEEEEQLGLDISEHGMHAYGGPSLASAAGQR